MRAPALLLLAFLLACGDGGPSSGEILPAGSAVPSVAEVDPALAAQIDAEDQVEREVPRFGAFVDGERVEYWLLGEAPRAPMPAVVLCRDEGGTCQPIDHPFIVDALPGEEGYGPYLALELAAVTERYAGERITSRAAVDAAVDRGLLEAPVALGAHAHCPIVHPDARLEGGEPPVPIHVRGMRADCFHIGRGTGRRGLGARVLESAGTVLVRNVYVLTREGEDAPLNESMRNADLTGDGDQVDSNNLFGAGLEDADYTPLWQLVTVTVPADTGSIDTSMDEAVAEITADTQLFDVDELTYEITPKAGEVVEYALRETFLHCPIAP